MTRRINGDALENRSGAAATGDVFTFDDAHADGGQWQAPGASAAWPVGSVFISVVTTNPATLLGFGTWAAFAAGRVLLGNDGATYPTDEVTGGATSTTHSHGPGTLATDTSAGHAHGVGTLATVAESSHTHAGGTLVTTSQGAHQHTPGTLATDTFAAHTHSSGTLVVTDPATGATYHTRRHDHEHLTVFQHSHPIASGQGSHFHAQSVNTAQTGPNKGYTYDASTNTVTTANYDTANATLPAMATNNTGSATARTGEAKNSGTATMWDTAHTVSGGTGSNGGHSHAVTTGLTDINSDHSHVMASGSTAAGSSHSHGVSGSTASDGAHSHAVNSGSTATDATSVMQPYIVVHMWKRTA